MTIGKEIKQGGYKVKGELADMDGAPAVVNDVYYPKSILDYSLSANKISALHQTKKHVVLLEDLIRTYTNEGELVLDNTA